MHSIRTDFGFNLWRSASKLKRSVIENNWWVLLVFAYSWIFLFFCWFFFAVNRDGDIVRESFSVKFILHSLWYTRLVYVFMNLLIQCDLLCLFFVFLFFFQPDVNITWNTVHIHRSIIDKIEPTSEYVEMVKLNTLSITLGYIFLLNVIRKMYFTVPSIDQ